MSINREDIKAAANRIKGKVRKTPVIDLDADSFGINHPLNLKLELLQHSGSFKARGAMNSLLSGDVPTIGVAAASGGNHGAAIAFAAKQCGVPANIFVPEVTGKTKTDLIQSYGATIHIGGAFYADALKAFEAFQQESGALSVHAYDQPSTLAGQGTVAREWQRQVENLDTVFVAVGGGGLIGGMAAWYRGDCRVIAVEPETCCALNAALAAGHPVDVDVSGVAADSLGARSVGELMFPLAQDFVAKSITVPDAEIRKAQSMIWNRLRLIAEPGGAAALAALTSGIYKPEKDERVGVLLCGSNTDPALIERA
ncbi:MAG: threonine/serine dehydratase [Rhizobiales bacterium]|nr:threonine/serine dehydratase [Hyphomicrobiales bacterium]